MKEKSMKKNFLISFLRTVIMILVPLLIFPYASRVLGKEGIGRVQYIQSIASYFQLFATFGVTSYGIREGAKLKHDRKKLGKFCTELFYINLITTGLALLAYCGLFGLMKFADYRGLLLLYILYVFFYGMNLDWIFNVLEDYVYITIRTAVVYGLSVLILFLFVKDRTDIGMYAFVCIFPYIGTFLGNLKNARKKLVMFQREKHDLKIHIRPMMLVFGIVISSSIYSLLDTTMLGFMRGDADVGLYTAASKLCRLVVQLITAVCAVFLPRLSYYAGTQEKKKFKELASISAGLIVSIAIPCAFGMIVLANQAIILFSGREFLDAVPATRILAVNLFFSAIDGYLGWQILVPNRKDKVLLGATIVGAITDFILNLIFIPTAGINGAAVATLVSEGMVFIICLMNSVKYMEIHKFMVHLVKVVLASIPVFVIGKQIMNVTSSVLLSSILIVIITALIYVAMLAILKDDFFIQLMCDAKRMLENIKKKGD